MLKVMGLAHKDIKRANINTFKDNGKHKPNEERN